MNKLKAAKKIHDEVSLKQRGSKISHQDFRSQPRPSFLSLTKIASFELFVAILL